MRRILIPIFAASCLLASGNAFAILSLGGGYYCNTATVTVENVSHTTLFGCFQYAPETNYSVAGSFPKAATAGVVAPRQTIPVQ